MITGEALTAAQVVKTDWYKALAQFQKPDLRLAVWQIVNTFVPYLGLWVLMVIAVRAGHGWLWLFPILLLAAASLQVRTFIMFHDCTHSSFFGSQRANRILGYITGIINFTPFEDWRHSHLIHHASVADLDRRGTGDVWTMTVAEYLAAPPLKRLIYRILRTPLFIFGIAPIFLFLVVPRFPRQGTGPRERFSVYFTDLALLAVVLVLGAAIGWRTYLLIQLPLVAIAGAAGVWLFYVQHQFEGVYWARHAQWDPIRASLEGASYYRLPKVLQWISGNIGLHHLHHLRPRIPNYYLQRGHDATPAFQHITPLTLRASFRSVFLNLWDETNQRLVSFGALRTLSRSSSAGR
jgi:omega-6 fatty acid desaturase (delta-12 desaturase)